MAKIPIDDSLFTDVNKPIMIPIVAAVILAGIVTGGDGVAMRNTNAKQAYDQAELWWEEGCKRYGSDQ